MSHRARLGQVLFLVGIVVPVFGCAVSARDFGVPQLRELTLGKSTLADIVARFGPPQQRGRAVKNGVEIVALSYSHADPDAAAATAGVAAVKTMALYFAGDVLVGYELLSTFKADSSDFDDTRVSDIARGITTEAQVQDLVGRPSGMYVYPLTPSPDERALVFLYGQKKGRAPLARKHLIVTVDAAGIVRDVQFEKSGEW
jgi:hypothetical protein